MLSEPERRCSPRTVRAASQTTGSCPFLAERYMARLMPEPAHPGAVLHSQFLAPLGLTSNQVAKAIGVLPDAVRRISQEEMHVSAKMVQRLGRYFGACTHEKSCRSSSVAMTI